VSATHQLNAFDISGRGIGGGQPDRGESASCPSKPCSLKALDFSKQWLKTKKHEAF
jgi:hypothetical protein